MRHTPEELLNVVYTYYSRGRMLDDPRWHDTEEHRRLTAARIKAARPPDYEHWSRMLDRLEARFPDCSAENWSFHLPAGNHDAGYRGLFKAPFMNVDKGEALGILVSFLVPYYVIYAARHGFRGIDLHLRLDSTEKPYAEAIATEIQASYPGYEPMPPEVGTVVVPLPRRRGRNPHRLARQNCLDTCLALLCTRRPMPRKITTKMTFDDVENEVLFTTSMLKADPDASDFISMTDGWLGIIDGARAKDRVARTAQAEADAARVVSNHRLDAACTKFGDELFLAVDKDRTSRRWIQFFLVPVGRFIRMALSKQVARVRGWLGASKDPVLEKHRDPLDQWSKAAATALEKTNGVALVRGEAAIARGQMAEDLTNERDGLHEALSAHARDNGLSRDWPDLFFLTQGRTKATEEPEEPPPPG